MARLALLLAALAVAQTPSGLQRLLDAELARFPGRAGVWVKHLTTGEEAAVRADDTFNSASVIKIPVLVLAFQMAEKGQLSLAERVTIRARTSAAARASSATTIRVCSRRCAMCCCRW